MSNRSIIPLFFLLAFLLLAACNPSGPESAPTIAVTVEATATAIVPATTRQVESTAEPPAPTETSPAAPPEAGEGASLDAFVVGLKDTIEARDFEALQGLMSDPFSIGYWLSEGVSLTPAEATEQFESSLLPEGAQIVWADPDMDLAPLLQGQPPATFLPPDKEVVATLLSYGWGENRGGEAIHFITRQADGSFRWDLMLYSGFGFGGLPTDTVAIVINSDEATFYDGPGTNFNPVATVFGGMNWPVVGVSQDNLWWRLVCYGDNNELIPQCWVSADPAVSSPTTLP